MTTMQTGLLDLGYLTYGDQVELKVEHNFIRGVVRYIGTLNGRDGIFYGIELNQLRGNTDGCVEDVMYFKTSDKNGIFVRLDEINKITLINYNHPRIAINQQIKTNKFKGIVRYIGKPPFEEKLDALNGHFYGLELSQGTNTNAIEIQNVDNYMHDIADAHKTFVCHRDLTHFVEPSPYNILIDGYTHQYCPHSFRFPKGIINLLQSYTNNIEFESVHSEYESNFYSKTYRAFELIHFEDESNFYYHMIGPKIIDHNRRKRKIIIVGLYSFTKGQWTYYDGQTGQATNYIQYDIIKHAANGRKIRILQRTISHGNHQIVNDVINGEANCNEILNEIAQQYMLSCNDLRKQFKNISIDLGPWFGH